MSKEQLIRQWQSGKKSYRAIAVGRYSGGYRDTVIIERADADALGGTRWTEIDRWDCAGLNNHGDIRTILLDGMVREPLRYRESIQGPALARYDTVRQKMVHLWGEDLADLKTLEMLAEYALDDRVERAPWEKT